MRGEDDRKDGMSDRILVQIRMIQHVKRDINAVKYTLDICS